MERDLIKTPSFQKISDQKNEEAIKKRMAKSMFLDIYLSTMS